MNQVTAKEKLTWVQWKAFFAAFAGWMLDAMDWMFLALALPLIIKEWGITLAQAGLLGGAAMIGVGITAFFAGSIADLIGRTKTLMFTIIGYAVTTFFCGFSQNFTQLFFLRIVCGIFLGGEWGIGATLINEYWPASRRAWGMCTVQSGWAVGYGIAALIFSAVVPTYGWRVLFFIGIIPAFVAVLIRYAVPEPAVWVKANEERKKLLEKKRKGEQLSGEEKDRTVFPLVSLFSPRLIKYTILGFMMTIGIVMAFWGSMTWIPTYLVTVKQLSIVKTGMYIFWLNVGAVVGYQIFGFLGDRYGRRFSFGLGTLFATVSVLIYVSLDQPQSVLLFGPVYGFFTYGIWGLFGVVLSELFPSYCRGSATNFCMNVSRGISFFSPYLLGAFATKHGLGAAIGLTAGFYLVGLVAVIIMPDSRKVDAERSLSA